MQNAKLGKRVFLFTYSFYFDDLFKNLSWEKHLCFGEVQEAEAVAPKVWKPVIHLGVGVWNEGNKVMEDETKSKEHLNFLKRKRIIVAFLVHENEKKKRITEGVTKIKVIY